MRNTVTVGLCLCLLALLVLPGCWWKAMRLRDQGIAAFQVGQLDEARQHLAESIETEPGDAKAYYYMGRTLHAQGYLEDALYYYQCCLHVKPGHAEARQWLDKAASELGPIAEELMFLPATRPAEDADQGAAP
ncbi:MAG: tetratricopeptide repeat protein [Phycisphaerae bacterium]|nr:tetratricopeptide repeat protein [Phycisphaerae bacterium]